MLFIWIAVAKKTASLSRELSVSAEDRDNRVIQKAGEAQVSKVLFMVSATAMAATHQLIGQWGAVEIFFQSASTCMC